MERVMGLYNLLSLLLGIMALGFAVHSIQVRFCPTCCCLSMVCCGGGLLCQLLEVKRRVLLEDWSALMDTADAVVLAASVLLALTAALNLIALLRKKNCPECQ